MVLMGRLVDYPLPDLLGIFLHRGETGLLEISSPTEEGSFYLKDGQLIDAALGQVRGADAIALAGNLPQASFKFKPLPPEEYLRIIWSRNFETQPHEASIAIKPPRYSQFRELLWRASAEYDHLTNSIVSKTRLGIATFSSATMPRSPKRQPRFPTNHSHFPTGHSRFPKGHSRYTENYSHYSKSYLRYAKSYFTHKRSIYDETEVRLFTAVRAARAFFSQRLSNNYEILSNVNTSLSRDMQKLFLMATTFPRLFAQLQFQVSYGFNTLQHGVASFRQPTQTLLRTSAMDLRRFFGQLLFFLSRSSVILANGVFSITRWLQTTLTHRLVPAISLLLTTVVSQIRSLSRTLLGAIVMMLYLTDSLVKASYELALNTFALAVVNVWKNVNKTRARLAESYQAEVGRTCASKPSNQVIQLPTLAPSPASQISAVHLFFFVFMLTIVISAPVLMLQSLYTPANVGTEKTPDATVPTEAKGQALRSKERAKPRPKGKRKSSVRRQKQVPKKTDVSAETEAGTKVANDLSTANTNNN